MVPVESSAMEAVGYDAASRLMHVRFKPDRTYAVHGVMPQEHAALLAASSKGSHYQERFAKGGKHRIVRLEER